VEQVVVELDPHVPPRAFNECSVSARNRSGRLVLSPRKVDSWSWNQRITSSAPG
jgi:hypothetical protein